jgi:hypothetical protein
VIRGDGERKVYGDQRGEFTAKMVCYERISRQDTVFSGDGKCGCTGVYFGTSKHGGKIAATNSKFYRSL